jgi:hypothetical protein
MMAYPIIDAWANPVFPVRLFSNMCPQAVEAICDSPEQASALYHWRRNASTYLTRNPVPAFDIPTNTPTLNVQRS